MNKLVNSSLLLILALSSCKKGNDQSPPPPTTTSQIITITDSVKIGDLWWTTVNYNGTGGVNYNNSPTNIPSYGKLYTISEALQIKLPGTWRLPRVDDYNTLLKTFDPSTIFKDAQGNYVSNQDDAAKLMGTSLWFRNIGTNSTGFNAIPVGFAQNNTDFFVSGVGYSALSLVAAFLTQSQFVDATNHNSGHASFFIFQPFDNQKSFTQAFTTSIDANGTYGQGRGSIRFVRNN